MATANDDSRSLANDSDFEKDENGGGSDVSTRRVKK